MNCKKGDLAIVVRAPKGAQIPTGAIVLCVALWEDASIEIRGTGEVFESCQVWDVEWRGCQIDPNSGLQWGIPDADLRPIRDQPGEDEILCIAGRPVDQREPA